LAQAEGVCGIERVRVCGNSISVSHLLFANDSLIFMKANIINATSLIETSVGAILCKFRPNGE
jgi:hypothetical protein